MKKLRRISLNDRFILGLAWCLLAAGCSHAPQAPLSSANSTRTANDLLLRPHGGDAPVDAEIRRQQERLRAGKAPALALEQLGWLFVAKARASFDPGYYKLAEQCAVRLTELQPDSADALLLRGHVLHALHHFRDAEGLARELVTRRGLSFDYGLLGDILCDLGRVKEATTAYQAMLDLKPDPRGYARAAHVRWLTGDLSGALDLILMAARGASPEDAEAAAWMHTRLALYLWQGQRLREAAHALDLALQFQENFAPAFLLRGKMLMAEGQVESAIEVLKRAAQINPLPEAQWALSEALRMAHKNTEAQAVENQLAQRGAATDPRSYSLFLSTRGEELERALCLASKELEERADILTYDALAWALAAAGRINEARNHMARAMAEGTQDARLYFHAAVIAARAGEVEEAKRWLEAAQALRWMLLPGEATQLEAASLLLSDATAASIGDCLVVTLSACGD